MPTVGFEPTILAGERRQTYALDRADHCDRLFGTLLHVFGYNMDQSCTFLRNARLEGLKAMKIRSVV